MNRALSLAACGLIGALVGLAAAPFAEAQQSGCAELGGNIQSGNVCHVRADTPAYIIDMRFGTDYPDSQPVTDYLTQSRDRVINAAQTPGAKLLPYLMTLTTDSYSSGQPQRTTQGCPNDNCRYGQPRLGTRSLVINSYEYVGGTPGNRYKSFTFDVDHNRRVTFDNLFAPGSNPIDSIYHQVAADLARQEIYRHFQLSPAVGRDPAHYRNFAVTDDAVIFFFDTDEFMTSEAGYLITTVSRANLPPLQL